VKTEAPTDRVRPSRMVSAGWEVAYGCLQKYDCFVLVGDGFPEKMLTKQAIMNVHVHFTSTIFTTCNILMWFLFSMRR
jgi:hypothetical protein